MDQIFKFRTTNYILNIGHVRVIFINQQFKVEISVSTIETKVHQLIKANLSLKNKLMNYLSLFLHVKTTKFYILGLPSTHSMSFISSQISFILGPFYREYINQKKTRLP